MPELRQDWHPEDIKAAIRKTGITLSGLALKYGYCDSAVRSALRMPAPRLELIIARYLKTAPELIWPSRYTDDGIPLSWSAGHKGRNSPTERDAQRQIGAAA